MKTNHSKTDNKTSLRRRAEEKLKKKFACLHNKSTNKTEITQELWVHQIELEMQNEDLRKAQLELEDARRKYSDLYDFAPTGYFVIDQEGIIVEANLTSEGMTGIERNRLFGQNLSQYICKESQDTYYLSRRQTFKEGACRRCELKMLRKKNGRSEFYVEAIFDPIIDTGEKITHCRVGIIDITKRKKMEEELRRSKDELENRIKDRTTDLLQVVNLLRAEIEQRKQAELSLEKRTRDLDAFFSGAITPLVILDTKFNFVRVNKAYADACKRNMSDFEGHNHFEFYPNEENQRIFEQVVKTKKPYQAIAKPFVFPDHPEWGITHWDCNLVPVLDNTGEVELLAFSLKDVTENIRAQKVLEEKAKYERSLIEANPDPMITITPEGKITDLNSATEQVTGIEREKLINSDFSDYFTEPQRAKEAFQKGVSEGIIRDCPLTIHHTSGKLTDVIFNATIYKNEKDKLQGVFAVARDITQLKRQQETLKKIKSRLTEAQRIALLGNWDWDIKENSLWLSDESYRIFGIEPGKFEGKFEALCNYIHPDDKRLVVKTIKESIENCKPYKLEHRIVRKDGIERWIHKRGEIECDVNGAAIRMVGTIQDITERKKAENQIILSRQKLRTLAAKMEMVEEQERRKIASDLHDSVGQILAFATRELKYLRKSLPQKTAETLTEIADQLDKAVVQTRTLSFDLSPSILYDIGFEVSIEDLAEKFSKDRKINCVFENDHHEKPMTTPIKILLYRSIRELLMNIAKHAEAKNVKVSLTRAENNIQVVVEDDGKGFDVADFEKIKGFGIFNVRERLEHTGGSFKIESAPDKGTKVTMTAPLNIENLQ